MLGSWRRGWDGEQCELRGDPKGRVEEATRRRSLELILKTAIREDPRQNVNPYARPHLVVTNPSVRAMFEGSPIFAPGNVVRAGVNVVHLIAPLFYKRVPSWVSWYRHRLYLDRSLGGSDQRVAARGLHGIRLGIAIRICRA